MKQGETGNMSAKLPLTLACGDYEIVKALKEGSIAPDGIELNVLTDMDSSSRHWRMIRNEEFDVCELSGSSYLMAKDRGQAFSAIPVFPAPTVQARVYLRKYVEGHLRPRGP